MKRASITEAKNRLSALLSRVRHGETVLIEDRGVAVAQIAPVAAATTGADRDALSRLERAGIVRPAASAGPSRIILTSPPRPARPVSLSRLVAEEREAGW